MNTESLVKQIAELPPMLQAEVADFVEFLSAKDRQRSEATLDLEDLKNDPAIGMWADREDMKDGIEWVRKVRRSEWAGGQ